MYFNALAARAGLPWRAVSRGLDLERGVLNIGPMARVAVEWLRHQGVADESCRRFPAEAVADDFARADRVIALDDAEHRPLVVDLFPDQIDRVEFWQVEDAPGVLPLIGQLVGQLIAALAAGANGTA
ncbi:MAG: hypothetical protein U0736_24765 [Gemmataceae bacterium]